ncbi:hypothetical protein [Pedobacter chinensis]|nr:hypothetical protein [Pedobacter chinensis]
MEKFIDPSVTLMDITWKNHGKIYVISDNKSFAKTDKCEKIYRYDANLSWMDLLHQGLLDFKKDFKNSNIVYFMLEDLTPLKHIDLERLQLIEDAFIDLDWSFLYFPHYENEFFFNITHKNQLFSETSDDWLFYSQIGVGLFKLDYLIELCKLGLSNKLKSPWEFEYIKTSTKHYISSYKWPTVRDGYSIQNHVNLQAIRYIDKKGILLWRMLFKTYLNQIPNRIYRHFFRSKMKSLIMNFKNMLNK